MRAIKSQGRLSPAVVSASRSVSLLLFSLHADQRLQLSAGRKVALDSLQVFKSSHFRRLSQSEARISPFQFKFLEKVPGPAQTSFSLFSLAVAGEVGPHATNHTGPLTGRWGQEGCSSHTKENDFDLGRDPKRCLLPCSDNLTLAKQI